MPNVGLDQFNKPAPAWYRRLTNAMILCFIPAYVAVVQSITVSDSKRNVLMCIATAVPFLMKGIGMILGNGEYVKTEDK
jgi:putative effector of murein hydrolase LrgA (UPF0299 family)